MTGRRDAKDRTPGQGIYYCWGCDSDKPESAFYLRKRDGGFKVDSRCAECQRARTKARMRAYRAGMSGRRPTSMKDRKRILTAELSVQWLMRPIV